MTPPTAQQLKEWSEELDKEEALVKAEYLRYFKAKTAQTPSTPKKEGA